MVSITATNSANPPPQISLGKARLEQARREADQAEARARDLRAQADDAEQQARHSRDNVRKASARVIEEAATYSHPRDSSASEVPLKVQKLIEQIYGATTEKRALNGNALKTNANAAPVVNIQGQATGRIVNIST